MVSLTLFLLMLAYVGKCRTIPQSTRIRLLSDQRDFWVLNQNKTQGTFVLALEGGKWGASRLSKMIRY